jgi:hypothetical protein
LLVQGGLWILTAIFFIAWLHRAYKNLQPLGVLTLRFGPGWAIGAWFVPIMNLFRPKQIVNDVWRGSDPAAHPVAWRDAPVPFVFAVWWIAYLAAQIVGTVAERSAAAAESLEEYEVSSAVYIGVDSLTVLAGILAVLVVDMTTARQAARVAGVGGEHHPGARAPRWLRGGRQATAAAVLLGLAISAGFLTLAVQPDGSDTAPVGGGDTAVEPELAAPEGFSFSDDFSDPNSGWPEQDDARASFAYSDGKWAMTVKRPNETWFSFLDFGVRVDHVALEADAILRGRVSNDHALGIGCFASDRAGYLVNVWRDGYYMIGLEPEGSDEIALLADGSEPEAAVGSGHATQIGIECESGPPALLTLTVDGRTIAETRHGEGLGSFRLGSLIVSSGTTPATGHFDNLVIQRVAERGR